MARELPGSNSGEVVLSERTIMAVVSDLIKTGLTVEQQMLVNELALAVAGARQISDYERERKRAYRKMSRTVPDKRKEPKEKYILNNKPLGKGGVGEKPFVPDTFDAFWQAYPRKVGKGEARKAYRNALKRATAEQILAGAQRYAASKPDPQFTKHPGPWLNADRWLDEPDKSNVVSIRSSPRWQDVQFDYKQKYGAEAFKRYCEDCEKARTP